jgi:biotin synthase
MPQALIGKEAIFQALTQWPLETLLARADAMRAKVKGPSVLLRAIIEFSNHCVRNCMYCGLQRVNSKIERYRMRPEQIVEVACAAAAAGIGTVVLQSGEDLEYPAEAVAGLVSEIKARAEVKVTLSLGERPAEDYALWRRAGADRYLMKHETANPELYAAMHPGMDLKGRLDSLRLLKSLGYEIGSGFIVGLPGQTLETLAADVGLTQELGADMCGVGPFVPQADTPLAKTAPGDVETTLKMIALLRLACPEANIPATTALASLAPGDGQRRALEAGANVIMPNFTPENFRKNYQIYDNKTPVGLQTAKDAVSEAKRELVVDGGLKSPCKTHPKDSDCT